MAAAWQRLPVWELLASLSVLLAWSLQVIYDHPDAFSLDKPLNDDNVTEIVRLSLAFLTQSDSPKVATVRMQEAFDTAYFGGLKQLDDSDAARLAKLRELEVCAMLCVLLSCARVLPPVQPRVPAVLDRDSLLLPVCARSQSLVPHPRSLTTLTVERRCTGRSIRM